MKPQTAPNTPVPKRVLEGKAGSRWRFTIAIWMNPRATANSVARFIEEAAGLTLDDDG